MPKARTLNPHQKDHATKGTLNLSAGETVPAGFGAYSFTVATDTAVFARCNGWHYDGRALTDPLNIVGKTLDAGIPYYVAGEIDDIEIESGDVRFCLLEEIIP